MQRDARVCQRQLSYLLTFGHSELQSARASKGLVGWGLTALSAQFRLYRAFKVKVYYTLLILISSYAEWRIGRTVSSCRCAWTGLVVETLPIRHEALNGLRLCAI